MCVFPLQKSFANADPLHLKTLGMPLKRAEALIHLAHATLEGTLATTAPADIEQGVKQLQTFPGIGALDRQLSRCAAGRRRTFFCRMII